MIRPSTQAHGCQSSSGQNPSRLGSPAAWRYMKRKLLIKHLQSFKNLPFKSQDPGTHVMTSSGR